MFPFEHNDSACDNVIVTIIVPSQQMCVGADW